MRPTRRVISLVLATSLSAALLLPSPAAATRPKWRRETRTYAGTAYTNFGLALPGVLVDCELGVTCVEVVLEPGDTRAHFEVDDVTGQSISGWALGWSPERRWVTLREFCGASEAPVSVADQQRLVIVFAVGQYCLPEGAVPTAGEVRFRIR